MADKNVALLYLQKPKNDEEFKLLRPQFSIFFDMLGEQDWKEIESFVEKGRGRSAWRKLMRRIHSPDVAAVSILNLQSTFRQEAELLEFIWLCWSLKVAFVSTEMPALSTLTADGRFLARFLALVHDVLMDGVPVPKRRQRKGGRASRNK